MCRQPVILATILLVAESNGAVTSVDWWTLSGISLLRDNGAVGATWDVSATQGTISGAHPLSHPYNGDFWATATDYLDTVTGEEDLAAADFLIRPDASGFDYTITLASSQLDGAILAIGNLSPLSGTSVQILPSDATAAPISPVAFLSSHSWDAGFDAVDGPLTWVAATNTLSPTNSSGNESQIAFFQLPETGIFSLTLAVTGSSALPPGDSISIAVGQPIPEPTNLLLIPAFTALLSRRRR